VIFCGGAFTDRSLAEFFYDIGIPVAIGYGSTEACTVITVNDLKPFRADSVGRTVPGMTIRIADPGPDGVGEVQVHGPTVFAGYLDAPELTEAVFDGPWLKTGDLGWLDASHHLHLVGRQKNMIVTPGGKNIYPEDIEHAFAALDCEELVVFAQDYIWPKRGLGPEHLVAVVRPREGATTAQLLQTLQKLNRRLPDFKRVRSVLVWDHEFSRTASMKVKRIDLAQAIRTAHQRDDLEMVTA
jgi:long-chain acyl-CoA synthetase